MAASADDSCSSSLSDVFQQAVDHVATIAPQLNGDQLLYLYARYKQVNVGKCNIPKPGFFDFQGKQKWDAWNSLKDMDRDQAMTEYVDGVRKADPTWEPREGGDSKKSTLMGPVVSTMSFEEEYISDKNKTVFDWCKEGNTKQMARLLSNGDVDINQQDAEGLSLLHWACDRGHEDVVRELLQHKANINIQDEDGQTPLHYAATCEFLSIVQLLLDSSADPSIPDSEGSLPLDSTDSKQIKELLTQWTAKSHT
ncbi:PREDICTED: acyl-CoA-binding domain-containing protein 6-like [Branchiostoma belcheri]|uniref:Acyl-CoA-binding domain-containing protein 6 n=1 Tax=Branchiostoma belcheri TaxID=7741 RepID=A0A6P4YJW8_BRABE|nr:PREDICTED: acyl-CoA-binding domain-containing protein 6-like [Branchiostoma belcheri]